MNKLMFCRLFICLIILLFSCNFYSCNKEDLLFSSSGMDLPEEDNTNDESEEGFTDDGSIVNSVVYDSGTDNYIYYRIPAILETKNGSILAFSEARNTRADFYDGNESKFSNVPCASSSKDLGDIDLVVKRSLDGGHTWSDMIIVANDLLNTCGNPVPVISSQTGRIFLFWCWQQWPSSLNSKLFSSLPDGNTRRVMYCYSDDDGKTWSEHFDLTSELKKSDWTWYATGPGHAIVKQYSPNKGRIIIPANHRDVTNQLNYSHIVYSDDNGLTWKVGGSTDLGGNESTVVELTDGRLLLNMRIATSNIEGGCRAYCISEDGGISWGSLQRNIELIDPGCEGSINSYIDKNGNQILLLSNAHHATSRSNICISTSRNSGFSWTTPFVVWSGRGAYSDIFIFSDGSVGVIYEKGYGKYGVANPNEQIAFIRIPPSCIKTTLGIN